MTKFIIINNGDAYRILRIWKEESFTVKWGSVERHCRGVIDEDWKIPHTQWFVEGKNISEAFTRTFVLTEREAEEIDITL